MNMKSQHRLILLFTLFICAALSLAALTRQAGPQQERIRRSVEHGRRGHSSRGNPVMPPGENRGYADDHILVKFHSSLTTQDIHALARSYGSRPSGKIPVVNLYRVDVPHGSSVDEMLEVWSRDYFVEYAKPDYIAHIAVTPNDLFFSDQYALSNTGQVLIPGTPGGTPKADIRATTAWEETKGDADILIAIIDTGVDLVHPDLANKIASPGKDFVNEDDEAMDDHWHGTAVAGIAAAETNNGIGIAGVAWNCMILPVKVMDDEGNGYYSDVIEGIIWAVDNGAHVLNLSVGGDIDDPDLELAMEYAYNNGVVVAASSGNDASSVVYPAAYDRYVLAVASTDMDDERPPSSNFGPEIDVAAPGELVMTTYPTWDTPSGFYPYVFASGTSFSAPHVSGMAALIMSVKPWLSVSDIMNVIRYTADDVNAGEYPGRDDYLGYGRINLDTALVPIPIKK